MKSTFRAIVLLKRPTFSRVVAFKNYYAFKVDLLRNRTLYIKLSSAVAIVLYLKHSDYPAPAELKFDHKIFVDPAQKDFVFVPEAGDHDKIFIGLMMNTKKKTPPVLVDVYLRSIMCLSSHVLSEKVWKAKCTIVEDESNLTSAACACKGDAAGFFALGNTVTPQKDSQPTLSNINCCNYSMKSVADFTTAIELEFIFQRGMRLLRRFSGDIFLLHYRFSNLP